MVSTLHITNGDSAVDLMRKGSIKGDFLPWRDVLHEGPIQAGLSLTEQSIYRAQFIASLGWGDPSNIKQSFEQRDFVLQTSHQFEKIILWFEHDLYDQLQILQILDWFYLHPEFRHKLFLICTEKYLGEQTPESIVALQAFQQPVNQAQLILANKAWNTLGNPEPVCWANLLKTDCSELEFLNDAILRLLQEYPDIQTGLGRVASTALRLIDQGTTKPGKLFGAQQLTEKRRYLGDLSFWRILDEMLQSEFPLIQTSAGSLKINPHDKEDLLSLTDLGQQILSEKKHWLDYHKTDKWIGGVHLHSGNIWCWSDAEQKIVRR